MGGLEYEAEFFSELNRSAPHVRLHGAERHSGARGDRFVGQLIAAAQQEDLAAAGGELRDGVLHRCFQLCGQAEVLGRLGCGRRLTTGPLHPGGCYMVVAQVLERRVPRRHEQVRPGEALRVLGPARVPEAQEQVLNDVLRRLRRADQPEHVVAQLDVPAVERRLPSCGGEDVRLLGEGASGCGTRATRRLHGAAAAPRSRRKWATFTPLARPPPACAGRRRTRAPTPPCSGRRRRALRRT